MRYLAMVCLMIVGCWAGVAGERAIAPRKELPEGYVNAGKGVVIAPDGQRMSYGEAIRIGEVEKERKAREIFIEEEKRQRAARIKELNAEGAKNGTKRPVASFTVYDFFSRLHRRKFNKDRGSHHPHWRGYYSIECRDETR